ncbi:TIGR01777 family oxidoreductase [Leucobacter ruminantium]|uniref:TIGR01777 family oxidoreductase n=1 Tax=Leucobacter ruminantium TaxID=1289170 RepID=A0A939LZ56_9MICO|nr:TIGR01777 family oxidoreductase [Leucobacter ruminantium]MBO1805097.1 TIGR01777 family oxidoreductase [Leucobacter ruminantium]
MGERRIVVAGASGLIGGALVHALRVDGFRVVRLVRREAHGPDEIEWLRSGEPLPPDALAGAAAVVGLNGASIGRLPWTPAYRDTLRRSRIDSTRTLAAALRQLGDEAPRFISGSAVGFYGDRPGERLTETSGAGGTFLAELCREWEAEALAAGPAVRVVLLRTAPVIHRRGVLKPLIALTRLGLGGPLGSGRQLWPWISLEDEVRAIRHLVDSDVEGPVNLTGPVAASAKDIGRELARAMHRPFVLPAPAWALRLGLGRDAADSLLLADARVEPRALEESGFEFRHRTPAEAIAAALAE